MKYLFILLFGQLIIVNSAFSQTKFSHKGNPCVGSELIFIDESTIPATSWLWEFGNGDTLITADTAYYTYQTPGDYSVRMTIVSGGVNSTTTSNITIYSNPVASFTVSDVVQSSFARLFTDESSTSNTLSSFTWDYGDTQRVTVDSSVSEYKYSASGTYDVWLWASDEYGCTDSATEQVVIEDIYKVPNVFTPNNDGINDEFIVTVNGVDKFSIEIFSRWGNLVFKRESVNQLVWDGHMPDGSLVNPGTYFYVITAHDTQTAYQPEKGFISVFHGKDE